ncbi:hypothetical protein [Streptomyces buecherae]|uniref:Uncharacterized protein n=1 Tax=Streptomyces buecherae TaxID=2763006 RepID=A0A7H8N2V9_9ACTN|nr:hypothetical protein [Streptomyces buecherae]QKW48847.1 hypothetical protein HUT08_04030 [Streptomyces buecherae]
MSNADDFEELISGIETEMSQALIEKRGTAVVALARITGVVYTEAIAAGVPHALAQEMATDYWAQEMHAEVVAVAEEVDGDG